MLRNNKVRLIARHERRLQKLKEQQATLGVSTPPHILTEIEDIEIAIKELQAELAVLEARGPGEEPLNPPSDALDETIPKRRIQIRWPESHFPSLPADLHSAIIEALAAIINVLPQEIDVHRVDQGEMVLELDVPFNTIQRLRARLQSNSAQLRLLKIERVLWERESGGVEVWVFSEGKFHLGTLSPTLKGDESHSPPKAQPVAANDSASESEPASPPGLDQNSGPIDLLQIQLPTEKYPLADERRRTLVTLLAEICQVSPHKIQVVEVKAEESWIGVVMSKPCADRLVQLYQAKAPDLDPLHAKFRPGEISRLPVRWPYTGFEHLKPEATRLVQLLYLGAREVIIEQELGGGYGGATVLLVQPISRQGRPVARQIIKIGVAVELRLEQKNSTHYVEKDIPLITPRFDNYVQWQELAAMSYVFVGEGMLGQTRALEAYYQDSQVSTPDLIETLQQLLDEGLGKSWYALTVPHICPFADEYGRHLAEHLLLKIRSDTDDGIWPADQAPTASDDYRRLTEDMIVPTHQDILPGTFIHLDGLVVSRVKHSELKLQHPNSSGIVVKVECPPTSKLALAFSPGDRVVVRGEVVHNRSGRLEEIVKMAFSSFPEATVAVKHKTLNWGTNHYPNPLQLYPSVLNQILRSRKSLVHGDLHLRNILVDQAGRGWLIDFARVTERHNLYDFIKIETYIRQMILSQERYLLSFEAYLQFEEALAAASLGQPAQPPSQPDLQRAFQVIQSLREIATHFMGYPADFYAEYFPALFLYNVAVLKYVDNHGDKAARLAFATAAVVGKALTQDKPDPKPQSTPKKEEIPSEAIPDFQTERCQNLADNIKDTLALIKAYEDKQRLTSDPKTRLRAASEIKTLRADLARNQAEYHELGCG